MYNHILLDFDGTLMDTSVGIYNSFDYACDHYGIERKGTEVYRTLIGPPLADSFMNAFGFSPEKAREAVGVYREYYTPKGLYEVTVYDGVPQMLATLCDAGKKLYAASSKPEHFVRELLQKFNLDGFFTFMGGSDAGETRVKKCDVINYVLESAGIADRGGCLMVGDRKFDVEGAKKAGLDCAGALWGFGSRSEFEEAGATFVASSPQELCRILLA